MRRHPRNNDEVRLNRLLDRLERRLPRVLRYGLGSLRAPRLLWVRLPLGLLLVVGGVFSFLPLLGLWMLPLGLLLLAQDLPFLRRPTRMALVWAERRWIRWKNRRNGR